MPQFNILIEYSNAQPLVPFDRFQLVQGQYEENNKEWLEKLVTTLVASRIIIPVDSKGKPLIRSPKQRKEAYHVIAAKCKRTGMAVLLHHDVMPYYPVAIITEEATGCTNTYSGETGRW